MVEIEAIADLLRRVAMGEVPAVRVSGGPRWWPGADDMVSILALGYTINIFDDCGLDYISSVVAPDGAKDDFESWYRRHQKEPLDLLADRERMALECAIQCAAWHPA